GARRVMRERRAQAAIVEAARGGILRRGIALSHADVGLVTNVSPDHFGEYGIDDLDGLADTKLSIAAVVRSEGLLVLNADDPQLLAKAPALAGRFGEEPRISGLEHQESLSPDDDRERSEEPTSEIKKPTHLERRMI